MGRSSLGIGVVGLGVIGRVHAQNLAAGVPGAHLAMVADSRAGALDEARRLLGVSGSRSFADLVDDPGVDAVVVATPAATHPGMVERSAAACKPVLCEKPLGLDVESARAAVDAARGADVPLQVGFHRRFDRSFRRARQLVEEGRLGVIHAFTSSMRDMRAPPAATLAGAAQALIHDAACHDLDAARWLVGEVDEVTTVGAALGSDELRSIGQVGQAVTVLRFEDGALGTLDHSLASGYGFDCRCEIVGSETTLRVDRPYLDDVELLRDGSSAFARTRTFLERFADSYPRELEAFAAAARGEAAVAVTGEDGLAAVVLATAAQRSLETGRSVRVRDVE